jgi:transposase
MKMVHVGVDLHKSFSQVAVLEETGEIREHRLDHDGNEVEEFFRGLPRARVAIEATGTWWWLVDLLEGLGHEPVLSHPKQTKAIAHARLKNDRVDAERLALLSRGDLLPTVWIPSLEVREARELLRHRISLVRDRTQLRNRTTAALARRNIRPVDCRSWYSKAGLEQLRALHLSREVTRIRDDSLLMLQVLDKQISEVEDELIDRWGSDPRVGRLMTIPGIGWLTAIGLVVELGQISRFPSAKHLASYVGLTPRVRASGGRIRSGHISKEGNRLLRWLLVTAATQAIRTHGPLRTWYFRVKQRKGTKIARVGLARRLTEIVYHVWKDKSDYEQYLSRHCVRG